MPEQKEELEDRFDKAMAQSEEWGQCFENAAEEYKAAVAAFEKKWAEPETPFIGPRDHCTRKKADSVNAKQALMDKKMLYVVNNSVHVLWHQIWFMTP